MNIGNLKLITTVAVVISALVLVLLERIFPYTKNQKFLREGFKEDFFYYTFFQNYILGLVIAWIISFINSFFHLSSHRLIGRFSLLEQLIFFFVIHDFYIYWFHRLQHNSKILWHIHEAHHSNRQVDWLSGSRSHALEILINQTIEFLPIVLLGAAPAVAVLKGAIDAVWGMYIHSNIDVKSGRLQYFINGPEMHRWHHADKNNNAYNKNFATKLAIWDWLFNTAYNPRGQKPEYFGLSDINFPVNYFKQQVFAFRKFYKEG